VPEAGEPVRQIKDNLFGTTTRQIVQQEGNSHWLFVFGYHLATNSLLSFPARKHYYRQNALTYSVGS